MEEKSVQKAKSNLPSKTSPSPFAVVNRAEDQVRDIIEMNLGGQAVSQFDLDRIRVPDGKSDFWTIPTLDGTEAKDEIHGVVVHFKDMRAWWPDQHITGKPPSCRSDNGQEGIGVRTHGDNYKDDKADSVHDCDKCLYSQFGTDPKYHRGQWCKQVRAIFLVTEKMFLPVVVMAPPTSIGPVKKYFLRLGGYGIEFHSVVTGFKLDKEKNEEGNPYNTIAPYKVRDLSEEEKARFRVYAKQVRPAFDKVTAESEKESFSSK